MKTILITFIVTLYSLYCFSTNKTDTIIINENIRLIEIEKNFYIHESFTYSPQYGRFPSNGLLVIKNGKALMIDTPFTNEETKIIYDFLKENMQTTITNFIGGHYHADCIGGMEYLKSKGVHTILNDLTNTFCIEQNLPTPDKTFTKNYEFKFEDIELECRFFGGGHSADNIIVYFPNERILFGGCLIKEARARNIGNTNDAVLTEWAGTVEKTIKEYPDVEIVIPGHGAYGGANLLSHTINIINNYNENQK